MTIYVRKGKGGSMERSMGRSGTFDGRRVLDAAEAIKDEVDRSAASPIVPLREIGVQTCAWTAARQVDGQVCTQVQERCADTLTERCPYEKERCLNRDQRRT